MREQSESGQEDAVRSDGDTRAPGGSHRLAVDVTLYTAARLGMVFALTAVLLPFRVPLLVALAVAVVVMMPLSLVLLKGLRHRVAVGVQEWSDQRQARRNELRAQLRGERDEQAVGAEDAPATGTEQQRTSEERL